MVSGVMVAKIALAEVLCALGVLLEWGLFRKFPMLSVELREPFLVFVTFLGLVPIYFAVKGLPKNSPVLLPPPRFVPMATMKRTEPRWRVILAGDLNLEAVEVLLDS